MQIYDNLSFMNQYIELLRTQNVLRRLSLIQLLAYFGAWFSNVAIYTLLLGMKVSVEVVAFLAMLLFFAGVLQAPISRSIIDKLKPKTLMLSLIVVEIVSTFLLIFIDTVDDLWFLYLLIFFKMASASFYFTTEMSLLPKILDGDKLQKANELHSIICSFSYTLGMALSGFVVYLLGVDFAFILDAGIFVVAFVLLKSLKLEIEVLATKENLLEMMRGTCY